MRQFRLCSSAFCMPPAGMSAVMSTVKSAVSDMPSTTPYHLATCYRGLAEYFRLTE
jgi:hypothetical protein